MKTEDYYNEHAKQYFEETVALDLSGLYARFLKHLPDHAHILDAGCGSGRDAKHFQSLGHEVEAFDASVQMASRSRRLLGKDVKALRFQDIDWIHKFDAIWACASLLHVPKCEMQSVMEKLVRALKKPGILYCSFKYGTMETERDGRYFNNYTEDTFASEVLVDFPELERIDQWVTKDLRPSHDSEQWLNVILSLPGKT